MAHALVVGGTGMLRGVCLHLAHAGHQVSVIARSHARLNELTRSAAGLPGSIHPLPVDYRENQPLALALRSAKQARGPITLALCWIRSDAPDALLTVADQIRGLRPAARLLHVLGSAAADPSRSDEDLRLPGGPDPAVQRIVLGFVIGPARPRWLTHEEIAAGVIRAIGSGEPETIVGTVRPWSERPA